MEVCLQSSKGLPDDAVISIRSGAVRRQGAVSSNRPFRFPKNVSDTDCVVKVDIMQTIGSGYIVLRPHQSESKQFSISLGKDDMSCELEVKPLDDNAPPLPEAEDAGTASKTKDAKEYMEKTGILQFVQGVLQVVVKQQPDDPFGAMAQHFTSGSNVPGSPKAALSQPSSPKAVPVFGSFATCDHAAPPQPEQSAPASPKAAVPVEETAVADNAPAEEAAKAIDAPAEETPVSPNAESTAVADTTTGDAPPIDKPASEVSENDDAKSQKSDAVAELTRTKTGELSQAAKDAVAEADAEADKATAENIAADIAAAADGAPAGDEAPKDDAAPAAEVAAGVAADVVPTTETPAAADATPSSAETPAAADATPAPAETPAAADATPAPTETAAEAAAPPAESS